MNSSPFHDLAHASLVAIPNLGIVITLLAYLIAQKIQKSIKYNSLLNPVLISITFIVIFLHIAEIPYYIYSESTCFINFLLGPAVVALAVPVYRQCRKVTCSAVSLTGGLLAGSLTSILSIVGIGRFLGLPHETILSLAPKSATTPIAMSVSEKIGGIPSLAAIFVICTGIIGAVAAPPILNAMRIEAADIRGYAIGVASHGIGTAKAFQENAEAGAFAVLGMALNGAFTALVLPLLMPWVVKFFGA